MIDEQTASTAPGLAVPIKRSEVVDRLGSDVLNSVVRVSRQSPDGPVPTDAGHQVQLRRLSGFHTRRVSGGRGERSYFPYLYAYGNCEELPVAHYGVHGECPHSILACVLGAEREEVWNTLCDLAGFSPQDVDERSDERERIKHELLDRLVSEHPQHGRKRPFSGHVGPTVEGWSVADVLFETNHWERELDVWLDLQEGQLVSGLGAGLNPKLDEAFQNTPDRFEKIPRVDENGFGSDAERHRKLLSDEDLAEVAVAFLRSRGFEPEKKTP